MFSMIHDIPFFDWNSVRNRKLFIGYVFFFNLLPVRVLDSKGMLDSKLDIQCKSVVKKCNKYWNTSKHYFWKVKINTTTLTGFLVQKRRQVSVARKLILVTCLRPVRVIKKPQKTPLNTCISLTLIGKMISSNKQCV